MSHITPFGTAESVPLFDPKRDDRSQRGSTGSVVNVYLCPFYAPLTVRKSLPF